MYNLKLNHLIAITTIVAFIIPVSLLTVAVQVAEAQSVTVTSGTTTIAESALDGAEIALTITGGTYSAGLSSAGFSVAAGTRFEEDSKDSNTSDPSIMSISNVVRTSNTVATVTLAHNDPHNNDLTVDSDITITVKAASHSGTSDITTSAITVTADALSFATADHTISVAAQNAAGSTVTSYSDTTTEIHLPMTWANSEIIHGSSLSAFLVTFFNTDEVDAVRFEGAEEDQTAFLHKSGGRLAPGSVTYGPAPTDMRAPTFCSDGSAAVGGVCASDTPNTARYCSSTPGDLVNICSDASALPCVSPATEQCSDTKDTERRPKSRVFSSSAAAALLSDLDDSTDLKTKFAAGTGIRDVGKTIAIDCSYRAAGHQKICLPSGTQVPATSASDLTTTGCPGGSTSVVSGGSTPESDRCTYGIGSSPVNLEAGLPLAKFTRLIIGDIGTEFKNGSICEQAIGFTSNPNGVTTNQDTFMKAAIAADPLVHPAAINAEPFNYCSGIQISSAYLGIGNLTDTPVGSRGVGKLVVTPKASHSGPLTFRAGGRIGGLTSGPGRVPLSNTLTIADAKAPVITAPTGNIAVSSGAFPITVDEGGTISMACGTETAVLDTSADADNQDTLPAGTSTSVSIVSGITPGTKANCVVTVADAAGNSATKNVGSFTYADTVAPTLSGVTATRTSTNALAKSDKYAKAGDTVMVSLNFSEPITVLAKADVTIKIGGASGTAVTTPDPETAAAVGAGAIATVQYEITVPASSDGNIYVSANNFSDGTNAVNTAETATTTTADDTLASFFKVDSTVPATAPGTPVLKTSSDTGHSTSDGKTSDDTPTITLDVATGERARAKAAMTGETDVTAIRDGDGDVTLGTLAEGTWTVTAQAVDEAGNTTDSAATLSVVVDTTAPATPTVALAATAPFASSDTYISSAEDTANASATLVGATTGTGKHDGSDRFVVIEHDATCESAAGTFDTGANTTVSDVTTDGQYRVCFKASDEAGNDAYATSPIFTRDTTDPEITIISLGSSNYQVTATDATTVTLEGANVASDSATCDSTVSFAAITGGSLTAAGHPCVKATDAAGNTAYSNTVLEGSPITGIELNSVKSAGLKLVNSRTFNLYGTAATSAAVTVKRRTTQGSGNYDITVGTATAHATTGAWTVAVTLTADGTYDFATTTVLSDSTALNTDIEYNDVVVDTTAPTASLATGAAPAASAVSNAATVTATVEGTGVTHYKHKVISGSSCTSGSYLPTGTTGTAIATGISATVGSGIADGSVTLCVIGRDEAGNWQAESSATAHTWTKDTTGPTVTIISLGTSNYQVSARDDNGTPTIQGTNVATQSACTGSATGFTTITNGRLTAATQPCVKATDSAGNVTYSADVTQGSSVTGVQIGSGPSAVRTAGLKLVNTRIFTLYGTSTPGATVTLKHRTTPGSGNYDVTVGTGTAGNTGAWTVAVALAADGTYDFATTTVTSGGVSLPTPIAYDGVIVDTTAPTATVSTPSASAGVSPNTTAVTATVSGAGVTHYKYKIVPGTVCGSGNYTPTGNIGTAVATGISGTVQNSLTYPSKQVSVCVIGRDMAGNWQAEGTATAQTATIVDNEAPTATATTATGGRGDATIGFTVGATQANEELTVTLGGSCSDFGTKTVSGPGAKSIRYTSISRDTYSDCTVSLNDGSNTSSAVSIPSFDVRKRSSGGGGRPGVSIAPTFRPTEPETPTTPPVRTATTAASLTSVTAPAPQPPAPVYRRGDRGTEILVLQQNLNRLGYTVAQTGPGSRGQETQYFGPATERAVMALQRASGITADGVFNRETRYALQQKIIARLRERIMEIRAIIMQLRAQS